MQDFTSTTQYRTVQGTIQEDIPIARINTSRAEKKESVKPVLDKDDCTLIADPAKVIIESLSTLFAEFKPLDEKAVQLYVNSVSMVEPFETYGPDANSKKTARKFTNLLDSGVGAIKKAGMIAAKEFARLDGIVVGQSIQRAVKSEDHG